MPMDIEITDIFLQDKIMQNESDNYRKTGTLYLCATPIGNLEDITLRVLRTLKEVDVIAAEDTRNSIHLLNAYEINTPLTSYHEYNKVSKAKTLVQKLLNGENIALITDAGTPAISDPGEEIVKQCIEAGIKVTSLPGACACITALTISGEDTRRFAFEAFLPTDKKLRNRILDELKEETRTMIMYESPHHLVRTLAELKETFGGDRHVAVIRELTKLHETALHMTLDEVIRYYESNDPRGEYVIVIAGKSMEQQDEENKRKWEEMPLEDHMKHYENQGMDRKSAMKAVAADRGVSKSVIYKQLLD